MIDASKYLPTSFVAAEDGQYYCQYIRFDIFNTPMSAESYVDIAYLGMCDSLDKIRELNSDMEKDPGELVAGQFELFEITINAMIPKKENPEPQISVRGPLVKK